MMKYILLVLVFSYQNSFSQSKTQDEPSVLDQIRKDVYFLSSDKLEGRRAGSAGEKAAANYIIKQFLKIALANVNGSYLQPFDINEGKEIKSSTFLKTESRKLILEEDYFPLPFSANRAINNISLTSNEVQLLFMHHLADSVKKSPHSDLQEILISELERLHRNGASVIFLCDTSNDKIKFERKDKRAAVSVPVIYLSASATQHLLNEKKNGRSVSFNIEIHPLIKKGHNVIGVINNNAENTIIIGAHYDHLGYGEDNNSLYRGERAIHNGADDNASGVAALIHLAQWLSLSALKNNNYVFVAFSGEELGLFGSKYFTDNSPVQLKKINYMINLDMVGRLNDSIPTITVGGFGTSPSWGSLISNDNTLFKVKIDSSGTGPSDHTSFYKKNIPVLFFFTGAHRDYHMPSDDAEKINVGGILRISNFIKVILTKTDQMSKLSFSKTRDVSPGRSGFKVTLGVMPDYTFSGNGVLVDGVSAGRTAEKAGIIRGDVIFQLGDFPFNDVETYMRTLGKFEKGNATKVKLLRGTEVLELDIIFQ